LNGPLARTDGADALITDDAYESDQDGSGLPACSEEM
jgi:hypothetical protein